MKRPPESNPARILRGAAVCLLACVWLAMLLLGRGSLDRGIYEALYAGGHPVLVAVARVFTAIGEPVVLIPAAILVAAWFWRVGKGRFALSLLLVILVGRALAEAQNYWIARARPTLEPHLVVVRTSSFPSGHATNSMIFFMTLALAIPAIGRRRRVAAAAAILLALLIGSSRVMLGVHWPSDVVGGWSFGLLWVLLTLRPAERLFRGDSESSSKQL